MVADVGLISIIVALGVFLVEMEVYSKGFDLRVVEFNKLYNKSLSDLARAEIDKQINKQQYTEAAIRINKCYTEFK